MTNSVRTKGQLNEYFSLMVKNNVKSIYYVFNAKPNAINTYF